MQLIEGNLMMVFSTIESDRIKHEIKKTILNIILSEKIKEYSKKTLFFEDFDEIYHMDTPRKWYFHDF